MKYHLTYRIESHSEGLEREQVPAGNGACTAVLLGSLLYPDDGSYSAAFLSLDGRTGEQLSAAELWKAWAMLAHQLAEDETLSPNKRALCKDVFEIVRNAILSLRESTPLDDQP